MDKENAPHKILLVAFLDESRSIAYEIITNLKNYGYSTNICFAKQENEGEEDRLKTKFIADIYLNENTDLAIYEGVVFVDDGADEKAAVKLAKSAAKSDLVVGGYGFGCQVLLGAKLLKDKFVCNGLDGKEVNSPAVRSDNIVTSSGNCPTGFVILLVDALGGKVKRIVESVAEDADKIPDDAPKAVQASLVVSRLGRWAEYWELAERLSSSGSSLMLAEWDDVDIPKRTVRRFLLLDPKSAMQVSLSEKPAIVPSAVWFKQTSIGADETIKAVTALESIGCRNVNSSEAIRTACDKMATARLLEPICYQGRPRQYVGSEAVNDLLSVGTRWAKPVSASLGKDVMKVVGRGRTAILSRRVGGDPVHRILTADGLGEALKEAFGSGGFMVQDDLGSVNFGDRNFELRFIMRRTASGWKRSCEIARAGSLISNPSSSAEFQACMAKQALKAVYPSDWESRLAAAREKALAACIAFQSGLENPDGVNELGVDITFAGSEPNVIEINSVPDLIFVDRAAHGRMGIVALARSMGDEMPVSDEPEDQVADSRGDVASVLSDRLDDRVHRRVIGRELAHQGMFIQPDGRIAVKEMGRFEVMPFADAFKMLKADANYYIKTFNELHEKGFKEAARAALVARRALHRLRLLYEAYYLETRDHEVFRTAIGKLPIKKADWSQYTDGPYGYGQEIDGPYAHIRVPERVIPVNDGDEWLHDIEFDEHAIRNLQRYHPESKDGFFAEFDLMHRNDPTSWEGIEHGDGIYPQREQLRH